MNNTIQHHLISATSTLRAFSFNLTKDKADANDLYQDTAVRLIAYADRFQPENDFKAWSVTIMRNLFINNYRKRARRNILIDQTSDNIYLNSGKSIQENDGEGNIGYEELLKMVNRLSEENRTTFWLRHQGYSYEEVATLLNIPKGTVKSRIFFARKKLQQIYLKEQAFKVG